MTRRQGRRPAAADRPAHLVTLMLFSCLILLAVQLLALVPAAAAFVPAPPSSSTAPVVSVTRSAMLSQTALFSSAEATTDLATADSEDDDEEWVYEEYENLTEEDFFNSEWKIGTVWNDKPNTIKETWVRLVVDDQGGGPGASPKNVAVWGDGGKGKWSLDVASQFFSVSKESFGGWFGKRIYAGNADDYYYLQGSVRGWSPLSAASVLGQWQMKRLGVDKDEAGIAPWFEEEEERKQLEEEMTVKTLEENLPTEAKKEDTEEGEGEKKKSVPFGGTGARCTSNVSDPKE